MLKLTKVEVISLCDAMNLFPHSIISSVGELHLFDKRVSAEPRGIIKANQFGKTYLVDERETGTYLIIGEYLTNRFEYKTRMEYVPKVLCIIHKEWELQE